MEGVSIRDTEYLYHHCIYFLPLMHDDDRRLLLSPHTQHGRLHSRQPKAWGMGNLIECRSIRHERMDAHGAPGLRLCRRPQRRLDCPRPRSGNLCKLEIRCLTAPKIHRACGQFPYTSGIFPEPFPRQKQSSAHYSSRIYFNLFHHLHIIRFCRRRKALRNHIRSSVSLVPCPRRLRCRILHLRRRIPCSRMDRFYPRRHDVFCDTHRPRNGCLGNRRLPDNSRSNLHNQSFVFQPIHKA